MNTDDYKELLKPIMDEYKKFSYLFWKQHLNTVITFEGKSDSGEDYQVEIQPVAEKSVVESIRVLFSIDNGGWRAYSPITDSFSLVRQP